MTDSVTFAWDSPGPQTVTVTANTAGSVAWDVHVISIELHPDSYHYIYLPLVLRH